MAKTSKAKVNKNVSKANENAINCFPKAQLVAALDMLAHSKANESLGQAESASASLDVTRIAADYGVEAHGIANGDTSTVLKDWKDNVRLMAIELAAAGSPFAETATNKAGETIGKLTGTGNNVLSIAKGVVDFKLAVDDCVNDDGEVSYRSVRSTVEARRAERRNEENPELAALADAKEAAREAWKALSKVVFDTNDIGLINELTVMLNETTAIEQTNVDQQIAAELEAQAKAEAAAEAEAA